MHQPVLRCITRLDLFTAGYLVFAFVYHESYAAHDVLGTVSEEPEFGSDPAYFVI